MRHGHQVFGTRFDPLHRPVEPAGELGDHDVFGVRVQLGPESAAHVRRDDPDPARLQPQQLAQRIADRVRLLRGRPDREDALSLTAVVHRHGPARLERDRRHALVHHPLLHDHRRVPKRGIHIAPLQQGPVRDVRAQGGIHERGAGGGALEVHHGGLRGILNVDEVGGVSGRGGALGDDDGDRLPGVERDGLRERRVRSLPHPLDGDHGNRLLEGPEIGRPERRDDAGLASGGAEVDLHDLRVRVRTSNEGGVQHAGEGEVVDVRPFASDQLWVLDPLDARADELRKRHSITVLGIRLGGLEAYRRGVSTARRWPPPVRRGTHPGRREHPTRRLGPIHPRRCPHR